MRKKNFAGGLAVCLVLATVLGNVPVVPVSRADSVNRQTEDRDAVSVVENTVPGGSLTGGAVTGGAVTGGAVTGVPDATATATTTPESTQKAEPANDKLPATTLAARSGNACIRLTWEKLPEADGYYLYGRMSSETAYMKIATIPKGATTEYTKTSLVNGTTYYFRIAAYRVVGGAEAEGDLSAAVSAVPVSVSATSKTAKKYGTKAKFVASPAYKTYKNTKKALNYSKSFAIPGMKTTNVGGFACTTMVPQGICLANGYFLITAYDYKNIDYSVVYVVSRASKSYITTIVLPSKAKVGGIACDGTNIWISKGKAVASFPYQVVTDAVNAGTSYTNLDSYRSVCQLETTASFMGFHQDILWIGTFNQSSSTMRGYRIENRETMPSLSAAYTMAVPGKTQGITFANDGTMLLTRSYRTRKSKSGYISQVRTYRPTYPTDVTTGKVLKNTALKVTTLPPMAEGVAVYGTYSYVLFSSSYYKSCKYPVDRVLALKTNKLVT